MESCLIFQKLVSYFQDEAVDEVLLNGVRAMVVSSRIGQAIGAPLFEDADVMLDWVYDFAQGHHARLDAVKPFAGGHIQGGKFRWHAVLPPVSGSDIVFSLRRARFGEIGLNAFSDPLALLPALAKHIEAGGSLLVCGLPGAGKSTLLSALMKEYCFNERLLVLEELAEFQLMSPHWIQLVARGANTEGKGAVPLRQLFFEALRLRPERMVLGEIRDHEDVAVANQIMAGMQKGLLATFHAGDLTKAKHRLRSLAYTDKTDQKTAFCLVSHGVKPVLSDFIGIEG